MDKTTPNNQATKLAVSNTEINTMPCLETALKNCSNAPVNNFYELSNTYTPTLAELENARVGLGKEMVSQQILLLVQTINDAKGMSPQQIKICTIDFLAEFPNDPIGLVRLFCRKARSGYFKETYGSIDEPKLMRWYRQFRDDALAFSPTLRKEPTQQALVANTEPDIPMPDDVKERLDKKMALLGNGLNASKYSTPEQDRQKLIDKTRRKIIAQGQIPITDPDYVQKTNELINAKLAEMGLI